MSSIISVNSAAVKYNSRIWMANMDGNTRGEYTVLCTRFKTWYFGN